MASQELYVAACVDDVLGQSKGAPTPALAHLSFRQRQQSFCSHCAPRLPLYLSDLPSSIFLGNLPGSTLGAFVLDTRCLSQIVAGLVARLMLPSSPSLLAFPLHFVAICWSIVDTFWGRSQAVCGAWLNGGFS